DRSERKQAPAQQTTCPHQPTCKRESRPRGQGKSRKFDKRVKDPSGLTAVSASTARGSPADDGNEIPRRQAVVAKNASGPSEQNRSRPWGPEYDNADKAANDRREKHWPDPRVEIYQASLENRFSIALYR